MSKFQIVLAIIYFALIVANTLVKVFDGEKYSWVSYFYNLTTLTVTFVVILFLPLFKIRPWVSQSSFQMMPKLMHFE